MQIIHVLSSITADFRSMRNRVCKNSATLAMLTHDVTMPALRQHIAQVTYTALNLGVPLSHSRGYREFINYPGSFFFVKALVTPPLPSCLPNKVCFHPKMVCFSFFSFFVSQDLHATSDTLYVFCVAV